MLARLHSFALAGVEARLLEIEVHLGRGLPGIVVVGLPDKAVNESKDRVKAAILNSGFEYPNRRVTVNLAPADLKKEGPCYDLPIALGILAATEQIVLRDPQRLGVLGELALDGRVRPVGGTLASALACAKAGLTRLLVPAANAREGAVARQVDVFGAGSLREAAAIAAGAADSFPERVDLDALFAPGGEPLPDFAEVQGQAHVKRALAIAAAGHHNVLMIGPPGGGKTMLAQRLASILPPLTIEEALETTQVHSAAGLLRFQEGLIVRRPFRSPHHTVSEAGLVGGGAVPRPGELSLAHHGVLFLDEFPEFPRGVLESLRQPLEDGRVTIGRAQGTLTFPARIMLVAAMNPCPCGYYGDRRRECRCLPAQVQRYRSRISGPLLDRIDLHVEVGPVAVGELALAAPPGERSEAVRERVVRARRIQAERFRSDGFTTNAQMRAPQMRRHCRLDGAGEDLLKQAAGELRISARAYHRILRVARTLADLEGEESIALQHLAEALQYRPTE